MIMIKIVFDTYNDFFLGLTADSAQRQGSWAVSVREFDAGPKVIMIMYTCTGVSECDWDVAQKMVATLMCELSIFYGIRALIFSGLFLGIEEESHQKEAACCT